MNRELGNYLTDIINECEYLIDSSSKINYEDFIADEHLKRAFVRSLEIIGESARQLPKDFKKSHKQIKWKSIVGMRNIIAHEYFGINYKVIWKTVKERVPELKEAVERICKPASEDNSSSRCN